MEDLNIVLSQLKINKSRNPLGLANKLFRPSHAGEDIKIVLLQIMNQIKTQLVLPEPMKYCNITSIYKQKGS